MLIFLVVMATILLLLNITKTVEKIFFILFILFTQRRSISNVYSYFPLIIINKKKKKNR